MAVTITARAEDIDAVLSEAFENSIKASEDRMYKAGFEDGRKEGIKEAQERLYYAQFSADHKRQIEPYAEAFYVLLSRDIGPENIRQHRIGLDYTTGVPTVLSVVSADKDGRLEQLQELAYNLARSSYKMGYECQFWVITDHCLEQTAIDHDFPFYRR